MKTSEQLNEYGAAWVAFQGEITNPIKNRTVTVEHKSGGGRHSYSYAELPDIIDLVRPVLAKHGLGVTQDASSEADGTIAVITRCFHTSGQWVESDPYRLPAGQDAQSAGSAVTYARRYSLCAFLGIAADADDDGAKARGGRQAEPAPSAPQEPAQAPVGPAPKVPAAQEGDVPQDIDWLRGKVVELYGSKNEAAKVFNKAKGLRPGKDWRAFSKLQIDDLLELIDAAA
jgi:hypothetical protein